MKTTKTRKTAPPAVILKPIIDYPQEGEIVGPFYALRVSAPEALVVHIAIDQGPWLECRPAVGYWWFDWAPEESGEHEMIACALFPDGRERVSEAALCFKA